MVVADNPLAAEAGQNILRAGGTAVDAAIAAALVLGLVEPDAAGIGGGAFLLHYSAASKRIDSYDGQDTAPAGADSRLFLDPSGAPKNPEQAAAGGRAVGVPGFLRLAKLAHRDHGRLPWPALFEPAIALAEQGFSVSARLHESIAADARLKAQPAAAAYFFPRGGRAIASGTTLRNEAYATSLRRIAESGPAVFYSGPLALNIVNTLRNAPEAPGFMVPRDLENYRAKRRVALCVPYRHWRICSMPPPSADGLGVLQAMAMLAPFNLAALPPDSAQTRHLIDEAVRLAQADRALFVADPDFVQVPLQQLLDPIYLQQRGATIQPNASLGEVAAGLASSRLAAMPAQPEPGAATLLSVVDQWGNAAVLTASLGGPFGAGLMAEGFLLNSSLTGFAFTPTVAGLPVANRVEGGKRPRTAMTPTMVLDRYGSLVLALGAPGGPDGIADTVRALVAALDGGRRTGEVVARSGGLSLIGREGERWSGAVDPKRGGTVLAD